MRGPFSIAIAGLLLLWAAAGAVTFAWDASPDAWVTNYALLYGTDGKSNYTERVDVGTNTTCTLTNTDLPDGARIYFVAVADGDDGTNGPAESLPSNQVSIRIKDAVVIASTTNNNGVVAGQIHTNLTVRGTAQVRTP